MDQREGANLRRFTMAEWIRSRSTRRMPQRSWRNAPTARWGQGSWGDAYPGRCPGLSQFVPLAHRPKRRYANRNVPIHKNPIQY